MSESLFVRTIQKSTTKLVVFTLLGTMMIFLVPMLSEKADARTEGLAIGWPPWGPKFSNVKGELDAGKWIHTPKIIGDGHYIEWQTAGSGFFGGNEKGRVLADYGPGRHVTFSWNNPSSGENTCKIQWHGLIDAYPCKITQGPYAVATFQIQPLR